MFVFVRSRTICSHLCVKHTSSAVLKCAFTNAFVSFPIQQMRSGRVYWRRNTHTPSSILGSALSKLQLFSCIFLLLCLCYQIGYVSFHATKSSLSCRNLFMMFVLYQIWKCSALLSGIDSLNVEDQRKEQKCIKHRLLVPIFCVFFLCFSFLLFRLILLCPLLVCRQQLRISNSPPPYRMCSQISGLRMHNIRPCAVKIVQSLLLLLRCVMSMLHASLILRHDQQGFRSRTFAQHLYSN